MRLKKFQQESMDAFDVWLKALKKQKAASGKRAAAGYDYPMDLDFPRPAWEALVKSEQVPRLPNRVGALIKQEYRPREDAQGRPVPHVCFSIPTGGGKTLLGAAALQRLSPRNGIVLWITPSRAIFQQTWRNFAVRLHPYRQMLEHAAGGRVKLLKKGEPFSAADVKNYLCVMPLMLQAADRQNGSDFLKIFRDSGKYLGFFPDSDDGAVHEKMRRKHPDLHIGDLSEGSEAGKIKRSLFNVLKIARPIIVLDEAHNSYSANRRRMLSELNPRMVLELSATPDSSVSNILVTVSGAAMQREEMIKLPINLHTLQNADWKITLTKAAEKLDELQRHATELHGNSGKYIRPIMLVRVERVGKEQRDGQHIHAEDVREYLIQNLNVPPDAIRKKIAEKDEIANEDLLSPYSPVRYILTKDALREGWDCPFAYVLTLLDTTRSERAITQMVGRVLRQPDTEQTNVRVLDESYVYCFNADVSETTSKIKTGLEQEGLGDIAGQVRGGGGEGGDNDGADEVWAPESLRIIQRRQRWRNMQLFLPQVLHREGRKTYRPIEYESDILAAIDWKKIARGTANIDNPTEQEVQIIVRSIDLSEAPDLPRDETSNIIDASDLTVEYFARRLGDVLPNPMLAAEIAEKTMQRAKAGSLTDEEIYKCRADLSERIRQRCGELVEHESRKVFCEKLTSGDIRFDLVAEGGFELPRTISTPNENLPLFQHRNGTLSERSLFEQYGILAREFNGLEKDFALHLDGHEAVAWWHRMAVGGYGLQGWKRGRMYPDFLVCIGSGEGAERRVLVLETKGMHLSGNPDTVYKGELLERLEKMNPQALECGDLELKGEKKRQMQLRILLENSWQRDFNGLADSGKQSG